MRAIAHDSELFSVRVRNGIAEVTMRCGQGRNALSAARMNGLIDIAHQIRGNAEIAAVILTGQKNFSAGVDLSDREIWSGQRSPVENRLFLSIGPDLCEAWERLEQITICAVEGHCVGGGLALAIACDWRVMARSAYLKLPEVPLGMNLSWNSNPRLVALVGPAKAKELVILGEPCDADRAYHLGLCEAVVDTGETMAWARARAQRITELPALGVRMSKQAINASANPLGYATSFMDRDQFAYAATTPELAAARKAFFKKSAPHKSTRPKPATQKSSSKTSGPQKSTDRKSTRPK